VGPKDSSPYSQEHSTRSWGKWIQATHSEPIHKFCYFPPVYFWIFQVTFFYFYIFGPNFCRLDFRFSRRWLWTVRSWRFWRLIVRRYIPIPTSGLKNKPSERPAEAGDKLSQAWSEYQLICWLPSFCVYCYYSLSPASAGLSLGLLLLKMDEIYSSETSGCLRTTGCCNLDTVLLKVLDALRIPPCVLHTPPHSHWLSRWVHVIWTEHPCLMARRNRNEQRRWQCKNRLNVILSQVRLLGSARLSACSGYKTEVLPTFVGPFQVALNRTAITNILHEIYTRLSAPSGRYFAKCLLQRKHISNKSCRESEAYVLRASHFSVSLGGFCDNYTKGTLTLCHILFHEPLVIKLRTGGPRRNISNNVAAVHERMHLNCYVVRTFLGGHAVAEFVETLRYKPEGR
jgi:hypothetical protein